MSGALQKEFHVFVEDFLDELFAAHPETATAMGIHSHDHEITDLSPRGLEREQRRLARALSRLKKLESRLGPGGVACLPPTARLEWQLLHGTIEAALFDAEEMRPWERDPNFYNDLLHQSLFLLMKRAFAPLEARVQAIIERERRLPDALRAAQVNLRRVPRVVAQLAIAQAGGTLHFLKDTLPAVGSSVRSPRLRARFEEVNAQAVGAYTQFLAFLEEKVMPRGPEEFGIGEQRYQRKLWLDECVDIPLGELLQRAYDALKEHEAQFREVAARIDSHRTPEQILEAMTENHPRADQILGSTTAVLKDLRQFLIDRDVISLPKSRGRGAACLVDESPEFLRELTFASLDVPGPLEKKSREYYYHVTLPDPHWTRAQQEQHLRFFSPQLILTTSIHEAYPGHLVHFLWVNRHPSKLRRLFGATSHVEGWAHYCEQMMIEQGFGNGDARLHLAQLHEAQLRLCRFIVGIEMHTRHMTFQRARNFFVRRAHMQPINAEREAKRGIVDPTYLVYTLGKMQFLRLREDLQKKQGAKFSLKKFHDACVQNGFPPVPLLRELLLGEKKAVI